MNPSIASEATVLEIVSTGVQIAFWCLVGTLSLLTYLHAKRTVFQPLKTEVFKLQLTSLTRISEELHGKGEWELLQNFDLDNATHVNSWRILDQYARVVLRAESDLDVQLNALHLPDDDTSRKANGLIRDTQIKPNWKPFDASATHPESHRAQFTEMSGVLIPSQHSEFIMKLEALSADPLVPSAVTESLAELVRRARVNLVHIREVSREIAPELHDKYPTVEHINSATVSWIHNRWNSSREEMQPAAEKVLSIIRQYYEPDLIGFANRRKIGRTRSRGERAADRKSRRKRVSG
ncbi:hypothetical protein [Paenarthrobacter nitroguajacolicus]|uniref:hypothetical protein n=1 Tax=Paenarthrobacter nitroguajacolicus TaxID=211146 RepID=UPI000A749202|nr:hypothetical protein [Paenarthrobacter nitroguajacolicus]